LQESTVLFEEPEFVEAHFVEPYEMFDLTLSTKIFMRRPG
jgi:hypothetical protein